MRYAVVAFTFLLLFSSFALAEDTQYDAIVVGSGAGGLGAAAQLSGAGKKVLVLEQHDRFGGYMTAFRRGDYRFEVSLHELDGIGPGGHIHDFMADHGVLEKVKFTRLDPLYRSVYPEHTFAIPADLEQYQALLTKNFPQEKQGIKQLFQRMVAMNHQTALAENITSPSWFKRAWNLLLAPFRLKDLAMYLNKPFESLLSKYVQDKKAKGVISQLWGYLGLPPEKLSAIYFTSMWGSYHLGGGYYPEGGSQAISDALAEFVTAHGGTTMTNARVAKILVDDGRVTGVKLTDGREFTAPFVVSNASIPDTVSNLVGEDRWPADYLKKVKSQEISMSVTQIFLGIRDRKVLAPLANAHSTFFNTSYSPLEGYQFAVDGDLEKVDFILVDYGQNDPDCAPPGGSVLAITFPLQYDYQQRWRRDEGYEQYRAVKKQVTEAMLDRVEKVLPGLREQIEVLEMGTPLTMERYTLNPRGAIYGYTMSPEQSILNRIPQETPIEGLYFAGAWTFPGGGQSACLGSGAVAAKMILREMD